MNPLRVRAIAAALARRPLFVSASARHLTWLAERATTVELDTSDAAYRTGDPAAGICVLLRGDLSRVRGADLVDDIRPVRAFDEVEAVRGATHDSDLVADAPSEIALVAKADLDALTARDSSFRRALRAADRVPSVVAQAMDAHESNNAVVLRFTGVAGPRRRALLGLLAQALRGYGDRVAVVSSATDDTDVATHDYLLVDADDPAALGLTATRTVHLSGDGLDPASAEARPDVYDTILLPPGSAGQRRLAVGACRLRLDLDAVDASQGHLERLSTEDRAAIERWARGVSDRTVGLALSGGGAWGYAHCAFIERLTDEGIPLDIISGSSAGTIVAAFVARYGPRDGVQRAIDAGKRLTAAALASMVSTVALRCAFEKSFDGRPYLEDLDTVCLPAATDVGTSRLVAFRGTTIANGIRASGSFPTIYQPTWIEDPETGHRTRFVDGAIASLLPDELVVEEGADLVLGSNCISLPKNNRIGSPPGNRLVQCVTETLRSLPARIGDGARSAFVMLHAGSVSDGHLARVVFDPPRLSTTPEKFYAGAAIRDEAMRSVEPAVTEAVRAWKALRTPS